MLRYIISLVVIVAVLFGQFSSIHSTYVMHPVYDFSMHILGGLGVGLMVSALIRNKQYKWSSRIMIIVGSALAAGIIWEILELLFDITGREPWSTKYYIDTAKDIMNDIIGGILVLLFSYKDPR